MRRADRLFEIIQLLRRQKLVRARDLAARLEVSERTIYRDTSDLMASGVPIEGEAGVGYALRQGFDLPPLMFDEHEIEALVLGARIVESWTDAKLADAAANVIAKVEAVVPERLRRHMADTALLAPARHFAEPIAVDPSELRRALRQRLKVHFHYRDSENRATARAARPLALVFYGPVWLLAAWCELRQDFRSFRLDRMSEL
jgi:predicted DNA-binding transcriptional regulator YafY